jgi:hypothetical protein
LGDAYATTLAALNSIVQWGVGTVSDAMTGTLTQDQFNALLQQTNAQIDVAAAGNTALAQQAKAQAAREMAAAAASAPGGSFVNSIANSLAATLGISDVSGFLANNWPWLLLAGGATYYALA